MYSLLDSDGDTSSMSILEQSHRHRIVNAHGRHPGRRPLWLPCTPDSNNKGRQECNTLGCRRELAECLGECQDPVACKVRIQACQGLCSRAVCSLARLLACLPACKVTDRVGCRRLVLQIWCLKGLYHSLAECRPERLECSKDLLVEGPGLECNIIWVDRRT